MFTAFFALLPTVLGWFMPPSGAAYILTYGAIFAMSTTYYVVVRQISGRIELGLIAGTMMMFSIPTIEYLVIQPSHVFVALAVVAGTVGIFHNAWQHRALSIRHACAIALVSLLVTHPLFWVIQVGIAIVMVGALVAIRGLPIAPSARAIIVMVGLTMLLNAYWLIPLIGGVLNTASQVLFAGNQDAIFDHLRLHATFVRGFAYLQMGGDWGARLFNGNLPYLFYFLLVAAACAIAALAPHSAPRDLLLALLTVYLLLLSLSLGPNAPITGPPWLWAYEHLPGFSLFRHFSRLATHAYVALVFTTVAALYTLRMWQPTWYAMTAGFTLAAVFAMHAPLFTGDVNGAANVSQVPTAYEDLNDRYLSGDDTFTVVTFPSIGYEGYTWSTNRNQDIFQQLTYFKELYLRQPPAFNRYAASDLNVDASFATRVFALDQRFEFYQDFDDDLNRIDARYVLVQKDQFDIERSYRAAVIEGRSRPDALEAGAVRDVAKYLRYFSTNPAYRQVEDNAVWTLFENTRYLPRIRSERVAFQRVNDAKYRIYVQGLQGDRALTFLQRFDVNWQLYAEPAADRDWCAPVHDYPDRLVECARGRGHQISDVARLWQRPLDLPHGRALGYANEWQLSSAALQSQLEPGQFSANPDGTIDVVLTLMYRPQAQFYAGLIVSGVALGATALVGIAWLALRRIAHAEAAR